MPYQKYLSSFQTAGLTFATPPELKNNNELYCNLPNGEQVRATAIVQEEFGGRFVNLFATDERDLNGNFGLYYVFAIKPEQMWLIIKVPILETEPRFESIVSITPGAQLYEREIKDLFGLEPQGHPWPKRLVWHHSWPEGLYPLRKDFNSRQRVPWADLKPEFLKVNGTGVYEIPVGPVHAGIIEPGHFRFSVAGEPIINMEAQLYYVHKGIEKLAEGENFEKVFYLSERISGDETFSNSLAYCQALEKVAAVTLPERAKYSRVVFAELERLVCHLGDLGGICVDVAYGFAAYQFQMLRNWTFQLIEETCGSRFLRSVNQPGGLRRDFLKGQTEKIKKDLDRLERELRDTEEIIKSNNLFIDRVEHTGVLTSKIATDLGAVGPAGRASGLCQDVRRDCPYEAYGKLSFDIPKHFNGDVNCRMNVKLEESYAAISLILQALAAIPEGEVYTPITNLEPYRFAFGCTEAPRGENIHWLMTGTNNTIYRYKIRTPSFCNWPALCHAVKGNIVPDFPLINKSFNLSYSGNDL